MFKKGDILIGNDGASTYTVTTKGTKVMMVKEEDEWSEIEVEVLRGDCKGEIYCVDSDNFDLFCSGEMTGESVTAGEFNLYHLSRNV